MKDVWFSFIISFIVGWPVFHGLAKLQIFDQPQARSSHSVPIVRGGGVAIMLSIIASVFLNPLLVADQHLLLALSLIGVISIISFADDVWSVLPQWRFTAQMVIAGLILIRLIFVYRSSFKPIEDLGYLYCLLGFVVVLVVVVGYTNSFNFMDGINGLAASHGSIISLFYSAIAIDSGVKSVAPVLFSYIVAGACLGFIPYNFPYPRMFMGDVGSASLGMMIVTNGIWISVESGWSVVLPIIIVNLNFILDPGITFLRRVIQRKEWAKPHREHFYQKMVQSGFSHVQVTLTENVLLVIVGFSGLASVRMSFARQVLAFLWGVAIWCLFYLVVDRVFQRCSMKFKQDKP